MAELADALDLGSSSSECRFDSCYPHSKSRRAAILVSFRLLFFGIGNKTVIFVYNFPQTTYQVALSFGFAWMGMGEIPV